MSAYTRIFMHIDVQDYTNMHVDIARSVVVSAALCKYAHGHLAFWINSHVPTISTYAYSHVLSCEACISELIIDCMSKSNN